MKLFPHKYLVFDFDATIDSLIIDWSKEREELLEIGINVTGDKNMKIDDVHVFQIDLVKKYGDEVAQLFIDWSRKFEKENYSAHQPNMKLVNFIKNNQTQYKFFLWTGNHIETITPVLSELNLDEVFEKIISRDSVKLLKPDPEGFFQIFIPETEKSDYLMIGDSNSDRFAAKGSGIEFIHVDDFENKIS